MIPKSMSPTPIGDGNRFSDKIISRMSQAALTRRKRFHMAVAAPDIKTFR